MTKSHALGSLFCLILFVPLGCIDPKNDQTHHNVDVIKTPGLKMSADVPINTVYAANHAPVFSRKKLKVSANNDGGIIYNQTGKLYTVTKNGGLGVDIDDENKMIEFNGIPLHIEKQDIKIDPFIEVTAKGVMGNANDEDCPKLFYWDAPSSTIKINTNSLNGLTICVVNIYVKSIEEEKVYESNTAFQVVLNLTFSSHYKKNDKGALYIKKLSGLEADGTDEIILKVAQYLKDKSNENLNLEFNPKLLTDEDNFSTLDTITAVQTLKSLNVARTNLNNLNSIINIPSLEELDISNTKIDSKDLKLLANLPNLKRLKVRNLHIKDATYITNFLEKLEELDISDNTEIENLGNIKNLIELKVLKARNIGLKSLDQIEELTQINSLDVGQNDLKNLAEKDANILINLFNLTELDVSYSNLSDEFLDKYFASVAASRLTKFVDRNRFDRGVVGSCNDKNRYNNILNLNKLINLNYLDLSGNSCTNNQGEFEGLINSDHFKSMNQLNTLNISNTAISDINSLVGLKIDNLIFNELNEDNEYDSTKGIEVSKKSCYNILGQNQKACNVLSDGKSTAVEFKSAQTTEWVVPANVFSLKVTACSGGDGGQGGQGGTTVTRGRFWNHNWSCRAGFVAGSEPGFCWASGNGGSGGGAGAQGTETEIVGLFKSTQETFYKDHNGNCGAGAGGGGGSSGGVHCGWWGNCHTAPQPSNGASGTAGQNKKLVMQEIKVTPGQVLNIKVGVGGAGGAGGAGGIYGWCGHNEASIMRDGSIACAWYGATGGTGGKGSDGYLKIEYQK